MEISFITNSKGKKLSAIIPIKKYQKILSRLEELEDILLYDSTKAKKEQRVLFKTYIDNRKTNYK